MDPKISLENMFYSTTVNTNTPGVRCQFCIPISDQQGYEGLKDALDIQRMENI